MALPLTKVELAWIKDAVDDFPGEFEELSQKWVDLAFGEFLPTDRSRVFYEIGVFFFLQARNVYKLNTQDDHTVDSEEVEWTGDVLASISASFFDAALKAVP